MLRPGGSYVVFLQHIHRIAVGEVEHSRVRGRRNRPPGLQN